MTGKEVLDRAIVLSVLLETRHLQPSYLLLSRKSLAALMTEFGPLQVFMDAGSGSSMFILGFQVKEVGVQGDFVEVCTAIGVKASSYEPNSPPAE